MSANLGEVDVLVARRPAITECDMQALRAFPQRLMAPLTVAPSTSDTYLAKVRSPMVSYGHDERK